MKPGDIILPRREIENKVPEWKAPAWEEWYKNWVYDRTYVVIGLSGPDVKVRLFNNRWPHVILLAQPSTYRIATPKEVAVAVARRMVG